MALSVSPLAVPLAELPPLAGVRLGAAAAGLRYQGRDDVVMIELASGTTVAGVFTSNRCPGAPVDWCRAAPPPSYEKARDELRQKMIQEGVQQAVAKARASVTVEKFNLDGSPIRATDQAEPPPAPK